MENPKSQNLCPLCGRKLPPLLTVCPDCWEFITPVPLGAWITLLICLCLLTWVLYYIWKG